MTFDLTDSHLESIVGFLGYGRPSATVWFVGIEEGLAGQTPSDSQKNLIERGSFEQVMDLYEAHMRLVATNKITAKSDSIDFAKMESFTSVWLWMARIVRAMKGAEDWSDIEKAKEYIRCKLGRQFGDTFLTELSPMPRSRLTDKHHIFFQERMEKIVELKKLRELTLRNLYVKSKPRIVIFYSAARKKRAEFQELFKVNELREISEKVSFTEDNRYLLLPFFGNGGISFQIIQHVIDRGLFSKIFSPISDC